MARGLWIGAALAALATGLAWLWLVAEPEDLVPTSPLAREPVALPEPGEPEDRSMESEARSARVDGGARSAVAPTAPATIRVRTIDVVSRAPIEGASIWFETEESSGERTSDAQGWCDTGSPAPAQVLSVRAEAPGYSPASVRVSDFEEVVLELGPLTALAGRVLDRNSGAPVVDAVLRIESIENEARALADGSFALADVPAGIPIEIAISAPGYATQTRQFRIPAPAGDLQRDFEITRARRVVGRVLDFVTRAPIAGVEVSGEGGSTETDSGGRFEIEVLGKDGGGEERLYAKSSGHCTVRLPVPSGSDSEVEFLLPEVSRIEGVVRDAAGRPVQGAGLRTAAWKRRELGLEERRTATLHSPLDSLPATWNVLSLPEGWEEVQTDASGEFRISGQRPWTTYLPLLVRAEGFEPRTIVLDSTRGPGEVSRMEIVLQANETSSGVLTGTVLIDGEPERGYVLWKTQNDFGSAWFLGSNPYRIEGLEPGDVELELQLDFMIGEHPPPDFLPGRLATVRVEADGETRHDFDVRFEKARVAGRVLDGQNVPLVGAHVSARAFEIIWDETTTARDGSFELFVPADDASYVIAATVDTDHDWARGVRAPAEGVELVIIAGGKLRFRPLDESGAVLQHSFHVLYRERGGEVRLTAMWNEVADIEGWYETDVPSGTIDLVFIDNEGLYVNHVESGVHVPAGDVPVKLEVTLQRGLAFDLVLTGDRENWNVGTLSLLVPPELWEQVEFDEQGFRTAPEAHFAGFSTHRSAVRFDSSGRMRVRGLAPGTYRFKVSPDQTVPEPAEITVDADTSVIEVRWERP